mmetsp:Transcript_16238/g.26221  ORF Transcript_16238/g.26221 Transcript_16238/m.26221 type:complete len:228 (+) Transcript_16238:1171-1854(+)
MCRGCLRAGMNDLVKRVEQRIASWSQIPVSHGEPMQVLRYEIGQEYQPHFDYFFHKGGSANNRIATVLMYLSDVEEGGETVFPNTQKPERRNETQFSKCGNTGKAVKPSKGDAILFWSMKVGGELDGGSSHAGCPVVRGEKWTATKWMHVSSLRLPDAHHKVFYEGREVSTESCNDTHATCHGWAEQHECTKNPGFMLEACPLSCKTCSGRWQAGSYQQPSTLAAAA